MPVHYNQLSDEFTVTSPIMEHGLLDERKPGYANSPFDKEYEKIGNYYVPWKFIPLGKSDKIKAKLSKGKIAKPNMKFLTPTGTEFYSEYQEW